MSCVCVDQTTDEKGRWLRQGRVGKSALLAWKDFLHACGDATNENGGMGWGSGGGGGRCDGGMGLGCGMDASAPSWFSLLLLGSVSSSWVFGGIFSCTYFSVCLVSLVMDGEGTAWGLDGLGRKKGENPTHTKGDLAWRFGRTYTAPSLGTKDSEYFNSNVSSSMDVVVCRSPLVFGAPLFFFSIGGNSTVFRQRMPPLTVMVDRYGSAARGPFWSPRMQGTP